jgi:DHA1 family purine ribonucleoside efflux pump-like MFS transporter
VTAFVAMFSSLFITQVIGTIDRRKVVILFSVLLTASCLLVSFANNFTLLLLGRACLGLGLGSGQCPPRSPCVWYLRVRYLKRCP